MLAISNSSKYVAFSVLTSQSVRSNIWLVSDFYVEIFCYRLGYDICRCMRHVRCSAQTFVDHYAIFIVAPLTGIANLMNAAGIVVNKEFGPFFGMYVLNLGIVCVNFARLMLTPLWKILKQRDFEHGQLRS